MLEPMPATLDAFRTLATYGETSAGAELSRIGDEVHALVPTCVGVSLSLVTDAFTFTLVADSRLARELDCVQYLDDEGPCLSAVRDNEVVAADVEDVLDEQQWSTFARARTAEGVRSSLSLPVLVEGRVVAGVNLHASTVDAFVSHHDDLARVCRAWQPGIVADADLTFSTRDDARATPGRLQDQNHLDQATGMLAAARGVRTDVAARRICEAAERSGLSEGQVARVLLRVLRQH